MKTVVFLRQLRFWSFHCVVNAAPSFVIALVLLDLWNKPSGILAMCLGIATFILLYSLTTSAIAPLSFENGTFARSLKAGAKVRSSLALIALIAFGASMGVIHMRIWPGAEKMVSIGYMPDFYSGFLANIWLEKLVRSVKPMLEPLGFERETVSFLKIYLTTIIEGFILSFLLLLISFFALIVIQAKERRKFLRSASCCGGSAG